LFVVLKILSLAPHPRQQRIRAIEWFEIVSHCHPLLSSLSASSPRCQQSCVPNHNRVRLAARRIKHFTDSRLGAAAPCNRGNRLFVDSGFATDMTVTVASFDALNDLGSLCV
jgi:hypothetical protein